MPDVPASASVWQEPQFAVKIDFPSVGFSAVTPVPGDGADVRRDVVDRLILVVDAEARTLDVVARRERLVDAGHSRRARRGVRDRVADLRRDDLRERGRGHPGLARLRERVVEVRPDRAVRSGVGERVAAAAGLDEELLPGALAPALVYPPVPHPDERERERGRARGGDEYDGPHGRRV